MKISPTKLSLFEQCPRRYRYHYIDRLAHDFEVERPYLSMGESVHDALYHFFSNPDLSSRTREHLHAHLRKNWKREGYYDVEEERRFGLQALNMLDRYYYRHDMRAQPFLLEYYFEIPVGNVILQGKIDRVDRYDDEHYTLIDYKTGQRTITEEEAATDLQLTFYALAFYKKYGAVCDRLELHYLANDADVATVRTRAQLDQAVADIGAMAEKISREKEFAPRPNPFCRNCPYNILCPLTGPQDMGEVERLDATNRRLYTLLSAGNKLAQSDLNADIVLDRALEITVEIGRCDRSAVIWVTEDKTGVAAARFANLDAGEQTALYACGAVTRLLAAEEPVLINQAAGGTVSDEGLFPGNELYLPLKTRQACWGGLYLHRPAELPFSQADYLYYQSFSVQVAVALENAIHYRKAICDGMTGLYNHAHFQINLRRAMKQSRETGAPVALFMFDIDNFKKFNDTYGHTVGDLVLQETARVTREVARSGDFVARYGGEEFAVILPGTDLGGGRAIAERIRERIDANRVVIEGQELHVTISGGVAVFPDHAENYLGLVEYSDRGLYKAKKAGKNQVVVSDR